MSQQPFPPSALRGAVDLSALKRPAAPARGAGPADPSPAPGAGGEAPESASGLVVTGTDATFQDFVTHLTAAPHVRNVRTSLVLHNSKYEPAVPLDVKVAG